MLTDILNTMAKFPEIAEKATVYVERSDIASVYEYRYWGKDKDLVEKALVTAKNSIDTMRDPRSTPVVWDGEFWVGYLRYYGLD